MVGKVGVSSSKNLPQDYMISLDDSDNSLTQGVFPVSPRELPKSSWTKNIDGMPSNKGGLKNGKATYEYASGNCEQDATASRLRTFSFPNENNSIVAHNMESGNASNGKSGRMSSIRSFSNNYSPQSPPDSSTSTSTPTRISFKSRTSSVSSIPTSVLHFSEFAKGEEQLRQQESESEALFNHLRTFEMDKSFKGQENFSTKESPRLRNSFINNSRRASLESPTKFLQDSAKRRSSVGSASILTQSPSDHLQLSPRSVPHRRASAVVDLATKDLEDINNSIRASTFNSSGNQRKVLYRGSLCEGKTAQLMSDFTEDPRRHSLLASPKLTIENTKEQLRRNSCGPYSSFSQFIEQNGLDRKDSIFAYLPETGDNIQQPIVNLNIVNEMKLGKPPISKKYNNNFTHQVSSTIDEEDSTENLSAQDPDEVVSLIEFLSS